MATVRYVHQIGHWDNAFPYHGATPSWHHRLREQDVYVASIGKLHFRCNEDDNGFHEEIDPMHVAEGIGEVISCLRERAPLRQGREGIRKAGPGQSSYLRYDASNADQACRWLGTHAGDEKPWALFLSFVNPHPPFVAPPELYELYRTEEMPLPTQWQPDEWPDHPALDYFRRYFGWRPPFSAAEICNAVHTYYAMCTYLDQKIGQLLQALEAHGLVERTRVIYTSDHGAMMGARGLFGKFTLYDEAAAIPFLVAGPDVPDGKVVNTPISLVDCYPTILEAVGVEPAPGDGDLPGKTLWPLLHEPDHTRTVFSEYHAAGSRHGAYMIYDGRYKYIHYTYDPPHLFDLQDDPHEIHDLAADTVYAPIRRAMEARLRSLLDPEAVDAQAKMEQRRKVEDFGGEEAVLRRGLSNSPVPGEAPVFQRFSQ
jgi:choline-sulfatase